MASTEIIIPFAVVETMNLWSLQTLMILVAVRQVSGGRK